MSMDAHKRNINEAKENIALYNQCWEKIDLLMEIKSIYGDLKISEIIENISHQAKKFDEKFKTLIK